jgi:hypothetical protein
LKKWGLVIFLLISLSWITSLAEGFFCDESAHETTVLISEDASSQAEGHVCHAASCHFGHCGHLHVRLQASPLDEPESSFYQDTTPYTLILSHAPPTFLMRPPLFISLIPFV